MIGLMLPHVPFMYKCEAKYHPIPFGGPCFVFQTSIGTPGGCQTQRHEKEGLGGVLEWLYAVKMETFFGFLTLKDESR